MSIIVKKLVIRYLETVDNEVSFRIVEQSHRNGEFGNGSGYFETSCSVGLDSVSCPAISYSSKTLYCRGHDTLSNNNIVKVTPIIWEDIKIAVKEYNECFGYFGSCILGEVIENIVPLEMFVIE